MQRTVPCVMLLDVSLRGAKRRGNLAVHNWITGRPRRKRKRLLEIATAPSGPRNDKLGSLMPMNLRCMICKCTRRSLSAATDAIGVYHFNGGLYGLQVLRRERHAAPLQGVCGRQSAAAFPSAIRYDYAKRTADRPSSACQKVPSGFFAKLLPELQNQFLYHDFAILPLRRVMERERTAGRPSSALFTASILPGLPAYCRYRGRNAHAARRLSPSGPSGRPCRGAARRGPCRPRRHPAPR